MDAHPEGASLVAAATDSSERLQSRNQEIFDFLNTWRACQDKFISDWFENSQQQKRFDTLLAWKAEQQGFDRDCRSALDRLEEKLDTHLMHHGKAPVEPLAKSSCSIAQAGAQGADFSVPRDSSGTLGLLRSLHCTSPPPMDTGNTPLPNARSDVELHLSPVKDCDHGDGREGMALSCFDQPATLSDRDELPNLPHANVSGVRRLSSESNAVSQRAREITTTASDASLHALARRGRRPHDAWDAGSALERRPSKPNRLVRMKTEHCILPSVRAEVEQSLSPLQRAVRSKQFEAFVMTVIVLNTFTIGLQTQVLARRVEESFHDGTPYDDSSILFFSVAEFIFTSIFFFDVGLRWITEGTVEFLVGREWAWNWFDILTVAAGAVDLFLETVKVESAFNHVSVMRVLRILRLVRVVRMTRTYVFFRELRMLVESCLCGLKSYMWCCLVIFLLLYLFGITLATDTANYVSVHDKYSDDVDALELHEAFGTLDRAMLSLFQSITGGRDWGEFYSMLEALGGMDIFAFTLFLSFGIFAVFNAVSAVFVESTMQSSQKDRDRLVKEQLEDAKGYQREMSHIFEEMDTDGTGTITYDEFVRHLDHDTVRAYFETLKLDVRDAASLFKILDSDQSNSVEIDEFIEGCHRVKGEARTLDMHFLRFEVEALRRDIKSLLSCQNTDRTPTARLACDPTRGARERRP